MSLCHESGKYALTSHWADLGIGGSIRRGNIDKGLLIKLNGRLNLSVIPLGLGNVSSS